jgi:hypothetical protein
LLFAQKLFDFDWKVFRKLFPRLFKSIMATWVIHAAMGAGLPDFSCCMIPKLQKCTKWAQNVQNGHKISQMSVKYSKWLWNASKLWNLITSKIYPIWDFWLENKPSGNPGWVPSQARKKSPFHWIRAKAKWKSGASHNFRN